MKATAKSTINRQKGSNIILHRLILLVLILIATITYCHGTKYVIVPENTAKIKAMFDTGTPMSKAKVLVFAPGSSSISYTSQTNTAGIFQFTPDKPGEWSIQVRDKSGHGMRINLDIDQNLHIKSQTDRKIVTILQKIIMSISIIWGFIGTALYFSTKGKENNAH